MTHVQVYKNLNRGDWSIRAKGKVIGHASNCVLAKVWDGAWFDDTGADVPASTRVGFGD